MKTLLIILFLSVSVICNAQITIDESKAECYYVYMANRTDNGNEKGDVIDVLPCSRITPPSHDYYNFDIIRMKLTLSEAEELKSPLMNKDGSEENGYPVEKPRKNKIEVKTLTEDKEYTRDEILSEITTKVSVVSADSR